MREYCNSLHQPMSEWGVLQLDNYNTRSGAALIAVLNFVFEL